MKKQYLFFMWFTIPLFTQTLHKEEKYLKAHATWIAGGVTVGVTAYTLLKSYSQQDGLRPIHLWHALSTNPKESFIAASVGALAAIGIAYLQQQQRREGPKAAFPTTITLINSEAPPTFETVILSPPPHPYTPPSNTLSPSPNPAASQGPLTPVSPEIFSPQEPAPPPSFSTTKVEPSELFIVLNNKMVKRNTFKNKLTLYINDSMTNNLNSLSIEQLNAFIAVAYPEWKGNWVVEETFTLLSTCPYNSDKKKEWAQLLIQAVINATTRL